MQILEKIKTRNLADHPCLKNVSDLESIHSIMENAKAFSNAQRGYIASLIARLENNIKIQSLLSIQLHDELGGGDFDKLHFPQYEAMVNLLANSVGSSNLLPITKPGYNLITASDRIYNNEDVFVALGANIGGEILADQFNDWFGQMLSKQSAFQEISGWYDAHDEAEENHAEDAERIYMLLETDTQKEAVNRGIAAIDEALWEFLNAMEKEFSYVLYEV